MRVLTQLPLAQLLDLDYPAIFGGHSGYGTAPSREPSGGDDDGGIGAGTIFAVLALAAITIGMLWHLSSPRTKARLRTIAPLTALVLIIAMPLVVWAAFSGGDEDSLVVERYTTDRGKPELIVSLLEKELNTLKTTNGRRVVSLECINDDGKVVLKASKRWPFRTLERGYDYPHAHQPTSLEQRRQADRCQLRGTTVHLESEVKGFLAR